MKFIPQSLIGMALLWAIGLTNSNVAHAVTWQNETGNPLEADYANLQFPSSITIAPGTTPTIYAQIYEAGVTEAGGPSGAVTAQLGYGPSGTDPRLNGGWLWFGASYNVQVGNNDEYQATFTVNTPGTYSYTSRFSLDGGASYTLGDLDGAGSNPGLTFDTSQMGELTVVPEPGATMLMLFGATGVLWLSRRVRRAPRA